MMGINSNNVCWAHLASAAAGPERGLQSAAMLENGLCERFSLALWAIRALMRTEVRAPAGSVPAVMLAIAKCAHVCSDGSRRWPAGGRNRQYASGQ